MLDPRFTYLAAALSLVGSATYVTQTLRGKTRPDRVSWLMWSVTALIAFAAQASQGVGLPALTTLALAVGPLLTVAASFANRRAYWRLGFFDYACGVLSALALVGWYLTRSGNLAIGLAIAADFTASLPTLAKSWGRPRTEDYRTYALSAVGAAITLATLPRWSFAAGAFQLYMLLACLWLALLVHYPRFERKLRHT